MTGPEQPTLPGLLGGHGVRDPLGRRYTPDKLALRVLERMLVPPPPGTWFADVHVGGGAFARQARTLWPDIRVLGVDIDPDAEGFQFCDEHVVGDWAELAAELVPRFGWPRIGGNPPFDDPKGKPPDPDRAQRHLRKTLEAYDGRVANVGWILPLAYLGTQAWGTLLRRFPPSHVDPVSGRPWGENVRETAAYYWLGSRDMTKLTPNERKVSDGWGVRLGKPIDDWN